MHSVNYLRKNSHLQTWGKKLLICTLITIYLSVSMVPKKAGADPVTIGAGAVTVGVGTYVVAALLVGGGAAILGYAEHSDEINAHARRIWNSATDAVKNELINTYNQAIVTGAVTMRLGSQLSSWLQSQYFNWMGYVPKATYVETTPQITLSSWDYSDSWYYRINTNTGFHFYAYWDNKYAIQNQLHLYQFKNNTWMAYVHGANARPIRQGSLFGGTQSTDITTIMSTILAATGAYVISDAAATSLANNQALKDYFAGDIAVPKLDDFIVYPKDQLGNPDKTKAPVVYSPASDTWANPAGDVYTPDKVVADIPGIKIRTDAAVNDVPTAVGVIGGVDVNVRTGEKVDAGTIPANPGLDWSDMPSDSINFGPLRILGNLFTTKFPFSIPWDIERQFNVFNVAPKPPVLKVDKTIPIDVGPIHTTMPLKFNIDFTIMEPAAVVVRWFMIIAFDLGMILAMRKFMPE